MMPCLFHQKKKILFGKKGRASFQLFKKRQGVTKKGQGAAPRYAKTAETEHCRITNEQVRKTIIKHIGPDEDLLATVKRRKLKWYGHVTRSDGLTKVIFQGTVEGSRRRGRPKNSWIVNIAEWTGKSFADTQAMSHNRQEWRVLTR